MKRGNLLNILESLNKGREALVSDFCTEDHRLYRPMFLHQANSVDMNLAINRYMLSWLTQHPSYFRDILNKKKPSDTHELNCDLNKFIDTYRNLCERFIIGCYSCTSEKSHVLEKVVEASIDYLNNLLAVSEKSDDHLERLRYQGEKSKHLFERTLNEIREGKNGIY